MLSATKILRRTPVFNRMFAVDESDGLEEINSWPALMIVTSFVWLAVAGLLGVAMPLIQRMDLGTDLYYMALTAHGAALAFPFVFQIMVGISLHRAGGCVGKPVSGLLPALIYLCMNVGAALLTVAILLGFSVSLVMMYPLPVVGVGNGQWSYGTLVLAFTGIGLVLFSMIVFYPVQMLKIMFFGQKRPDLILDERSINDPGMLGMALAALVLLIMGTPLLIIATYVLVALYGIIPLGAVAWATEPVVFQFAFFTFAHNLMEAMALMVISGVYATLMLYLADGTRQLYSNRLANLSLWILLLTSFSSFFHHFITLFPNLPATLAYHGNIMSWGTGIGAALSIFTILATAWKHGLRMSAGLMTVLMGFVIYILDGASAVVTSNVAWSFQLHGTMWQSGHTMTVLIGVSVMWMGVIYHHYPVMTGRMLDEKLGYWFISLFTVGAVGAALVMLAGGAAGMPRRFADWAQGGWMVYGDLIQLFGLLMAVGLVLYAVNFMKSRQIDALSESPATAPEPAE
ncbi:MAG: cbb3-type cytochrome c oxidase subunit I [Rhodospirillales bacterium]|jgi:cytochrome c oxidase subunit 1|nr:cbb3-type cytochrome c oxidase subunit I [Rhodospirillales bacterium]MDP6774324.1 cbb3-type cytochrome c oxidase subunit I [Rhodospirillales bacterium]